MVAIYIATGAIWIATVAFDPCLPSLRTPIHKGIHQGGRPEAAPPFVERRPKAASLMDGCLEAG